MSDKFGLTRTRKALTASDLATIDETFRKRIRSVQVLDQTVAELVQALADQGALDNTYLIFTSDNGYIMGNHRREIGKYNQFQGTVNVPFYVRGPGITPGSTYDDVAGNIDIAPTIAEIAGARTPDVDGVSLLSRLHGGPPLARKYYLLGRALTPTNTTTANGLEEAPETYVESSRSSELNDFTGVTNGRYKLIRYTHLPHEELYDLKNDPYELDNLLAYDAASYAAMSPKGREAVDTLRAALDRLVSCAGRDLPVAGPVASSRPGRSDVEVLPGSLDGVTPDDRRPASADRRCAGTSPRRPAPAAPRRPVRRAGRCRSRAAPAAPRPRRSSARGRPPTGRPGWRG